MPESLAREVLLTPSESADIDACNRQAANAAGGRAQGGRGRIGRTGAGKGALIGGALGAGGGTLDGIYDNTKNDERYREAYSSCMEAREYTG